MGNRDVFDNKGTMILLDKVYTVRFTMRAVFLLEEIYGSITNALKGLSGEPAQALDVLINFVSVLTGLSPKDTVLYLTHERVPKVVAGIYEAIQRDFPAKKDDAKEGTSDWVELYCIGRYRLLMGEDEFWNSTFKRFSKLYEKWLEMWLEERGAGKDAEPEIYEGPLKH